MRKHVTSRTWTAEDLEMLKKLVANGLSPARVAVHFKRSVSSVQSRARLEGSPFPHSRDVARNRRAKEAATRSELGLSPHGDIQIH